MNYFAYGSNMDVVQTEGRVGTFGIVGTAVLAGFELKFNKRSEIDRSGKANIVVRQNSHVEGVIFDFNEEQMARMDQIEKGYVRTDDLTVISGGQPIHVISYVADPQKTDGSLLPSREYLNKILEAAKDFNLSATYQKWLKSFPCAGG